jgi:hypothetical protein
MRILSLFVYSFAINWLFWNVPFLAYHTSILANHFGFDIYRYITAAIMAVRGEGIATDLFNDPIPVLWAMLWFQLGYWSLIAFQSLMYSMSASYLLRASELRGIPLWMMLVSIWNPILVTYVGGPSKEFFALSATMVMLAWMLRDAHDRRRYETVIVCLANLAALAVRPAHVIFIGAMIIAFRFPKYRLRLSALFLTAMLALPKNYEQIADLNQGNPSQSAIMQTFRVASEKPGILDQLMLSPLRMIFYAVYPFPKLSVWGLFSKSDDVEAMAYSYWQSVEALGFILYVAAAIAAVQYCMRNQCKSQITAGSIASLRNYYMLSVAALAIAAPMPHARYRIVALFGLPFFLVHLADRIGITRPIVMPTT